MPRKLTKGEFEELLKRAAERDAVDGPRDFSAEELLEAGRELGISRDSVMEVWREHEARQALSPPRPALPRPNGTRIALSRTHDRLVVDYRARLSARIAGTMAVAMFGAFGAFSLRLGWPVNLAGALICGVGVVASLVAGWTRTRLELDRAGGRLARRLGGLGYTRRLQLRGLGVRLEQESRDVGGTVIVTRHLVLEDGVHSHRLLRDFTVPEHRWVASELQAFLQG